MSALLSPLDAVLKRSGAHMAEREGWLMAADFGSLAAEIAVSRAAAGLADVSSVGKLELRGSPQQLAAAHPGEGPPTPGSAVEVDEVWWCAVSPELLLVLSPPSETRRMSAELDAEEVEALDVTAERVAVCLTGPHAGEILDRAGAAPAAVGTSRVASVAGIPTLAIHQRQQQWLLVAPASEARGLWLSLSDAGAPFGLAYVGADALQHLHAAESH